MMLFKWVYELKTQKLYKTKKENITKNKIGDDRLDLEYSNKKLTMFFYALNKSDDFRVRHLEGIILINNFSRFLIQKIYKQGRF